PRTVDTHSLVLAALDCVMAPVVYDAPPWAANDDEVATFGPQGTSCLVAARAAQVGSARLYRVDSDALLDLRRALRRPGGASRDPDDMLALFDEGVGAVMEARRARTTLDREAPYPSVPALEKIRARAMLTKLDDFGHDKGGAIGAEARAVARIVA